MWLGTDDGGVSLLRALSEEEGSFISPLLSKARYPCLLAGTKKRNGDWDTGLSCVRPWLP
jgi:hypothetical protein